MKRHTAIRPLLILLVAATCLFVAPSAFAQAGPDSARESGPIVRHKLLYRSTRFELAPLFGVTLNDAYLRNAITGATLSYHLTNEFGLSLVGGFGVTQFDTNLRENVQATLGDQALEDVSYSYIQWLAGLEFSYVPIFGKFSMFQSTIVNYDIHLMGGLTLISQGATPALENGTVDPALEGLKPAPTIGIGTRFFLGEGISADLEVRDYIYSRSEVSSLTSDAELKNNVMVSFGFSFFFPQDVKISR